MRPQTSHFTQSESDSYSAPSWAQRKAEVLLPTWVLDSHQVLADHGKQNAERER